MDEPTQLSLDVPVPTIPCGQVEKAVRVSVTVLDPDQAKRDAGLVALALSTARAIDLADKVGDLRAISQSARQLRETLLCLGLNPPAKPVEPPDDAGADLLRTMQLASTG